MTKKMIPVKISQLLFASDNPRLPELLGKNQREIFRFLVDEIGIDDLLESIAASGIIEGDPVIGKPAKAKDQYIVIEGNRRLAALKLLNGQSINDGGPEPSVPPLAPDAVGKIATLNIEVGWPEAELEAYLGYRHVTATREWPPEAKARFVIDRCKQNFTKENLSKFAKRVGTTPPTLRRWIVAYLALNQAEKEGFFDPREAYSKRYFGTFYTLLGSQQVQNFLALQTDPVTAEPVPKDHLANLKDFVSWSIGTKQNPPVINSRAQQKFDAVLSSPSALQHFRLKRDLESALLYTEYNAKEIAAKLWTAAYGIEDCLPKLFDVREEPFVISAVEAIDKAYQKLKLNTQQPAAKTKR
jgi:hypothetical protein